MEIIKFKTGRYQTSDKLWMISKTYSGEWEILKYSYTHVDSKHEQIVYTTISTRFHYLKDAKQFIKNQYNKGDNNQ